MSRWQNHIYKNSGNSALTSSIKKYGKDSFIVEEIDGANSQSELNYLETHYIYKFNSLSPYGYNLKTGGSNGSFSTDVKEKLKKQRNTKEYKKAQSLRSKKAWKSLDEEKKEICIQRLRNITKSEKHKHALKKHNDKLWSSLEYIEKMSKKAKKQWEDIEYRRSKSGINHHNSRKIICVELDVCFSSIIDAGKFIDISKYMNKSKNINSCCIGKQKTAFGYRWRYLDDE